MFSVPKLAKKLDKITDKIPGLGLGKEVIGAIDDIGHALGIGKTEADKRKDRTRKFHDALSEGDWAHIEKTALPQAEGGTRFKGLWEEAAWVLQQRALGYTIEEIQAAIKGTGGAEARGGRLANLDGSPNTTAQQWRNIHGTAPASAPDADDSSSGSQTPARDEGDSAPAAPRKPKRSTPSEPSSSSPTPRPVAAPRPKPPCRYGPRDADGYCPKKPPKYSPEGLVSSTGAKPKPACKYGPRDADGYCPKKPATARKTRAQQTIERQAETAITRGVTAAGKSILKDFGRLGIIKVAAKASLVGLAGVAAYKLTQKLMTLKTKNWDDLRYELSKGVATAKHDAWVAANPSNDPTFVLPDSELLPFNAWFKERYDIMNRSAALGVPPALKIYFSDD